MVSAESYTANLTEMDLERPPLILAYTQYLRD